MEIKADASKMVAIVAKIAGVPQKKIKGKGRMRVASYHRAMVMAELRKKGYTYLEIANYFGCKFPAVIHLVKLVDNFTDENDIFYRNYQQFLKQLE